MSGGGSTEIINGRAGGSGTELTAAEIDTAVSLDIGSVRLYERFIRSDPPIAEELEGIRDAVRTALRTLPAPPRDAALVGVAGTVTTLVSVSLGLDTYDASLVHGAELSCSAVHALANRLAALSLAERKRLDGLDPRRADVIVSGATLVAEIMNWALADSIRVSDRGVRWGLILEKLDALR